MLLDWSTRSGAVPRVKELLISRSHLVPDSGIIVRLFDKLLPLLSDPNLKVNICALEALPEILQIVQVRRFSSLSRWSTVL